MCQLLIYFYYNFIFVVYFMVLELYFLPKTDFI